MSESDSDESINSEELNQLQNELGVVFENENVKGTVDRKGYTQKIGKKSIDPVPKKSKGRPKKPLEEKLAKQIITKEKIIYMIPDDSGGYTEFKNPKLTKKDMKKIENEKLFKKEQEEIGRKLIQKRNGALDKRSLPKKEPTQKQIDARLNFVENNRKRAEERRKLKNEDLTKIVHNTIVDVVKTPANQIQKKPVSTPTPISTPAPAIQYTISKEDIAKRARMEYLRKKMGM
jgi:hypothetical protein